MSVTKKTLKAKSFSKIAKKEIAALLPNAKFCKQLYVPDIGNVLYVKDIDKNNIAHVVKESGQLNLMVK